MSKTLFENNACRSCSLNFGTVYDLIAHFELEHLPAFEMAEDRRRREDDGGGNTRVANLPLSYYFRLFPQPYRPTPRAPDNVRLSFCHYKKKVAAPAIDTSEHLMGTITTGSTPVKNKTESKPIEEEDDSNADLEEADPNDPTVSSRYRCQLRSCGKQFKNMNGVRHHMEIAHGGRVEEGAGASTSTSTPAVANGNQLQQSTVSRARSYSTLKCPQCNKRCKSQSALNTHMMKEHMKTEANPLATPAPAVSVSPVVVERPSSQPPPVSSAPIRPVASQPHLSSTVQQQPQQHQSNHHQQQQHHKSQSHANDQTMKSYAVGTQQQHQQQQQQNQPQTPQQQQQPIFHQPLGPQSFHYHPQQGGELQHYQQNPVTTQQHVSHHRGQHYQVSGSGHGYQAAGAVLHAELQRRGSLQGRNSGYGQSTASPPVTVQSHLQRPASRGLESNR